MQVITPTATTSSDHLHQMAAITNHIEAPTASPRQCNVALNTEADETERYIPGRNP